MSNRRVVLPVKRRKRKFETLSGDVVSFYASIPKRQSEKTISRRNESMWVTKKMPHNVRVTFRKPDVIVPKNPVLEILAEIAHLQWIFWTKQIAKSEKISPERLKRWKMLWKPYNKLTEIQKADDRIWARKYLDVIVRARLNGGI